MSNFNKLSRAEMKNVIGGNMPAPGSCGIKINGSWYQVSGGRSEAEGDLGKTGSWNGGSVTGTVTNWCCDSCYWNNPS